MKCLYPRTISPKKNSMGFYKGRFIPTSTQMTFSCGKCLPCRINYASEWAGRLFIEHMKSEMAYFLTFTYSPEKVQEHKNELVINDCITLYKKHLQLFFKKFRHYYSVRYYAVGEYGDEQFRAHYHACLFFDKRHDIIKLASQIRDSWSFGFIKMKVLSAYHYKYVSKYLTTRLNGKWRERFVNETGLQPEFTISSKFPAIGFIEYSKLFTYIKDGFISSLKHKYRISRYHKTKLREYAVKLYDKLINENQVKNYLKHYKDKELTYEEKVLFRQQLINDYLFTQSLIKG